MSLLEKIKQILGIKPKTKLLPEGINEKGRATNNIKRNIKEEYAYQLQKTPQQEIYEAIEEHKALTRKGKELIKEEKSIRDTTIRSFYNKIEKSDKVKDYFTFLIIGTEVEEIYDQVANQVQRLYESDSDIFDITKREEVIQTIKEKSSNKTSETIEQYIDEAINEIIEKYSIQGLNKTEMIDTIINNCMTRMELSSKIHSEINAEKVGIRYALINSINKEYELPKELEGKYEDKEDYIRKQKEAIMEDFGNVLELGAITESEKKALLAVFEKSILEKTVVQADVEKSKDIIQQLINQEVKEGKINPKATKFDRDWMERVLINAKKGADRVSSNNKVNTTFIYYDKDNKENVGPYYYDGEEKSHDELEQEKE